MPVIFQRIFVNLIFWLCVALVFPVLSEAAKLANIIEQVDFKVFYEIQKYFDAKLVWGLIFGFFILSSVGLAVGAAMERLFDAKGDLQKYICDEVVSQIINIGSVMVVINLMVFLASTFIAPPPATDPATGKGWLGVLAWLFAFLLVNCKKVKFNATGNDQTNVYSNENGN
ncbi:MAG: hypothetical protein RIQ62_1002 [Bacteroidota bacterium]|jgi:hypothetical protein